VNVIGDAAFEGNNLNSISIGANVELVVEDNWRNTSWPPFGTFYNNNGKRAGMYVLYNGVWSFAG